MDVNQQRDEELSEGAAVASRAHSESDARLTASGGSAASMAGTLQRMEAAAKREPWTGASILALTNVVAAAPKGYRWPMAEAVAIQIGEFDTANGISLLLSTKRWKLFEESLAERNDGKKPSARVGAALYAMVCSAQLTAAACFELFRHYFMVDFSHAATKLSKKGTATSLSLLWKQLELLPKVHVSDIDQLACMDVGYFGGGYYDPDAYTVAVGIAGSEDGAGRFAESVKSTIRHEVGHALHEHRKTMVDAWLRPHFQMENILSDELYYWLAELPAGNNVPESSADRQRRAMGDLKAVRMFANAGALGPAKSCEEVEQAMATTGHGATVSQTARKIMKASGNYCWGNWKLYLQHGGVRYFVNHHYGAMCRFSSIIADAVEAMGSAYATFSPFEFFAECYSEYTRDPQNPGGKLPDGIASFVRSVMDAAGQHKSAATLLR